MEPVKNVVRMCVKYTAISCCDKKKGAGSSCHWKRLTGSRFSLGGTSPREVILQSSASDGPAGVGVYREFVGNPEVTPFSFSTETGTDPK